MMCQNTTDDDVADSEVHTRNALGTRERMQHKCLLLLTDVMGQEEERGFESTIWIQEEFKYLSWGPDIS